LRKEGRRRTDEERGSQTTEFIRYSFPAIEKAVVDLGYECVNIALVTEDGRPVLRVMIDTLGGIHVGDCELVSKAINRYLDDEAAEFGDRYYLEVSSPGLERPLFTPADFVRFRGKETRIRTRDQVDGRKTHVGFIAASDDNNVTIDTEQGARSLRFADITRSSLVYRGLEPQPPKKTKKCNGKPNQGEKTSSKTAIGEEHLECS